MVTRNILPEEMKERTFIGSRPLEFNLEYKITVSDTGDLDIHRQGGILPTSIETYRYEIGGVVIVKPLPEKSHGNEDYAYSLDHFCVEVEYCLGNLSIVSDINIYTNLV